tara:strand:- start:2347 stop:2937 length:591 start_codon:yes stop_codon:yes gene_type:complete
MSRRHPRKQSLYQKIIKSKTFHWIDFYGTPLLIILIPLFFVFKSYDISENELTSLDVTVDEKPEFIKERKHRNSWFGDDNYHINIKTVEFKKKFIIQSYVYNGTKTDLVRGIKPNEKITIQILKDDFKELNTETHLNNYNVVYGLIKNGKSYISLDLRSELKSKDMRWLLIISLIGLVMLINSFIKKPNEKMKTKN